MNQDSFSFEDFKGTVRLFPLPNLVLFPHVAQPLHIFEPRYRLMMADALEDDRLLAMALLKPGWEKIYHKKPPIHPVICLGRILQEERLEDGRYNLMLQGLCRARIQQELNLPKPYRVAQVELFPDPPCDFDTEPLLRQQLATQVVPFFSAHPPAMEQLQRLLKSALPLGALCDIFSFALPFEIEVKQQLLEQFDIEKRVRLLLRSLEGCTPPVIKEVPRRRFPPEFSDN